MALTKHQNAILEILRDQKKTSTAGLSKQLEIAEADIRLDLVELENAGFIHCYDDGAKIVAVSTLKDRMSHGLAEKSRIARRAAAHVQEGETLYLDSGSTVMLLAKELAGVKDLTVITNSPPVLTYLGQGASNRIMLVGGEYSNDDQCCFGMMTEKELADIYVSKVFMGADSIDVGSGAVFAHLRNFSYIQTIIRNAKQTILLAESSKFNQIRGMKIVDLDKIGMVVTDANLPSGLRDRILQMGIKLEIAE